MSAYYNEIDPFAAAWLRNLIAAGHIAPGEVDERSIVEVRPDDLRGFTQAHFFAGIGVWSYALRLAGWPDDRPVWTGSCPCQPFSAAGRLEGGDDARHLWPTWHRLIRECRPRVVLGEQVAGTAGLAWLDLVHADLEAGAYAVAAADLCAAGAGAPHIRQRLFWCGLADSEGERCDTGRDRGACDHAAPGRRAEASGGHGDARGVADAVAAGQPAGRGDARTEGGARRRRHGAAGGGDAGLLGYADDRRCDPAVRCASEPCGDGARPGLPCRASSPRGVGDAGGAGLEGHDRARPAAGYGTRSSGPTAPASLPHGLAYADGGHAGEARAGRLQRGGEHGQQPEDGGALRGFWRDAEWIACRDGRARPVEPGTFPLAHGAPARVGRLRAYGNAIVAPLAAEFIAAVMECRP